jgi:hypothetical protein
LLASRILVFLRGLQFSFLACGVFVCLLVIPRSVWPERPGFISTVIPLFGSMVCAPRATTGLFVIVMVQPQQQSPALSSGVSALCVVAVI